MICKQCGNQVAVNAKYCGSCGSAISSEGLERSSVDDAGIVKEDHDNKIIFVLSYLGILCFLPLLVCPNSKTGRFHANQGLVLLLAGIGGEIVLSILSAILWRLWWLMSLINTAFGIALVVFMIIGMVNASKGEKKPLPIIGNMKILK